MKHSLVKDLEKEECRRLVEIKPEMFGKVLKIISDADPEEKSKS